MNGCCVDISAVSGHAWAKTNPKVKVNTEVDCSWGILTWLCDCLRVEMNECDECEMEVKERLTRERKNEEGREILRLCKIELKICEGPIV